MKRHFLVSACALLLGTAVACAPAGGDRSTDGGSRAGTGGAPNAPGDAGPGGRDGGADLGSPAGGSGGAVAGRGGAAAGSGGAAAGSGGAAAGGGTGGRGSGGATAGSGGSPTAGSGGSPGSGGAAPCTGAAVRVTQSGTRYTLDNGIVQATVNATDATLPSFVFQGVETMQSGGYFTFGTNVYTAGPFKGSLSANPAQNGGSLAEVAMTTTWNGAAGVVPLDIEIRYALPRCSSGVYEYVVITHPASYPAFTPGEMRVNHYLKWDNPFNWYAVDDTRRGLFTSVADAAGAQAVPGAPVEVLKYRTGPFSSRPGWQKYDNTVEWGEGTVYGWSSTGSRIGLWLINPSNEYLGGGPLKTELTVHEATNGRATLLNYWGGSHFYGALEPLVANQRREKVLGPWLLYANGTELAGSAGQDALWADAKARLGAERAAWPYAWESDPRYLPRAGRGSVSGRLALTDAQQPGASVANAWVGLAGPPAGGAPSFQRQGWDYQYWVRADAQGSFSLANVRPGRYTLHAFVAGIHGVYMGDANGVTVSAGADANLGAVTWRPDRQGATVWEIGVPDRTPREFMRGGEAWHYGVHLLFGGDFPSGVDYVVGTSTPARNWNYLQPGGTWNVRFDVAAIPAGATGASLVLDVAGTDGITVRADVNGTQAGMASFPYDDASIDRDQPHGLLQSARIAIPIARLRTGANTLALTASGRLMWDYLRLEWVVP